MFCLCHNCPCIFVQSASVGFMYNFYKSTYRGTPPSKKMKLVRNAYENPFDHITMLLDFVQLTCPFKPRRVYLARLYSLESSKVDHLHQPQAHPFSWHESKKSLSYFSDNTNKKIKRPTSRCRVCIRNASKWQRNLHFKTFEVFQGTCRSLEVSGCENHDLDIHIIPDLSLISLGSFCFRCAEMRRLQGLVSIFRTSTAMTKSRTQLSRLRRVSSFMCYRRICQ